MFQKLKKLFCRSAPLTVAIDCENMSFRRIPELITHIKRMQYDQVHYQCFLNPNHPRTENWTNTALELMTARIGHTVEFVHHACKWSKKSSQDVSLAVHIMDQYQRGVLGDLVLVSGDKDFEPLVDQVGCNRKTFVISPVWLNETESDSAKTSPSEPKPNPMVAKNQAAVDVIVELLTRLHGQPYPLAQVGDYLGKRNIKYYGRLTDVVTRSTELEVKNNHVVLKNEQTQTV